MEPARTVVIFVQLLSYVKGSSAVSQRQYLRRDSALASLTLQAKSLQLNEQLQGAADALPDGPTRDLLQALRLCAPCKTYERMGEEYDGGYVMCMDGLDKGLVGAMSYGIGGYDGWGMKVASLFHIPLHEYDCTDWKRPPECSGCEVHFHPYCIRGFTHPAGFEHMNDKTLGEQIVESGFKDAPNESLLLKIDVGTAAWEAIADAPISSFEQFREIVVEYYSLGDTTKHLLYAQAVKILSDAGFRVTHLHGNNIGGPLHFFGEYSIPNVLEVTYIRGSGQRCASGIPYHLPEDRPNDWGVKELDDARLPAST